MIAATAVAWGQLARSNSRPPIVAAKVGGEGRNPRKLDLGRVFSKEYAPPEARLRRRLEALRWYEHAIGGSLPADASAARRAISVLQTELSLRASYGRQSFWLKMPGWPDPTPPTAASNFSPPLRNFLTYGVRFIAAGPKETRLRVLSTASLTKRLVLGWEFSPRRFPRLKLGRVNVICQWLAVPETELRPALIVGTGADRLGAPPGQSFYFTLHKQVSSLGGVTFFPYVGASYGTFDDRLRPIGGLNLAFSDRFDSRLAFDGVHFHPSGSAHFGRHDFSLLLVRSRDPGLSYSVTF